MNNESRGIEASDHETTVPKTQEQGTQAKNKKMLMNHL
ncbi:hypothetical protein wTpre_680 [Wolbachia endosymbiont of Trichogramma pretiosum]|nr:hypothetical protein wTpre_680 [Wolbachia endosymbiont of Trichogramma pretiosum]